MDYRLLLLGVIALGLGIPLLSIVRSWRWRSGSPAPAARKVDCPYCGRSLRPAPGHEVVTCDGCGGRFNRKALRVIPPSLGRRLAGEALIILGGIAALTSLLRLDLGSVGSSDYQMGLGGRAFVVIVLLGTGFSLVKEKVVAEKEEVPEDVA